MITPSDRVIDIAIDRLEAKTMETPAPRTVDGGSWTVDSGWWVVDGGSWIIDHGSWMVGGG